MHEDDYAACAEFYDSVDPYNQREDVAFYENLAREARGPILELGCGTGRVLLPSARAGYEITGLDASAAMLAVCRKNLAREGPGVQARVVLHSGDMRAFDLGRKFALITIPFRPFQHLETVTDQLACLACVRQHLAPGGRFVFDLFDPRLDALVDETRATGFGHEPEVTMPDGRKLKRWARVPHHDRPNQVLHCELIYDTVTPDGAEARVIDAFRMRYLFRFEAEHLLARAGFEVEALYCDYDKSPYGAKPEQELIFVAHAKE